MTNNGAEDAFAQWEAMLTPEVIRGRLIRAGLFSLGYELLETAVVGRLRDFYADFTATGLKPGKDYQEKVLSLDPKGKGDALRGSLAWLIDAGALSPEECETFWAIKRARNEVAHELSLMVGGSKPEAFAGQFDAMRSLHVKIQRWWVIHFDVATDPAWDGIEIDPEQVMHGSALVMQILVDVALGDGNLAEDHLKAFQAEKNKRRGRP